MTPALLMDSPPGPITSINGERFLYFGGTSYFGLHADARLADSGCRTWRLFGTNTATSRRNVGTAPPHLAVEQFAAAFLGVEQTSYVSSGLLSSLAGIQALSDQGRFDVAFVDEHTHYASRLAVSAVPQKVCYFRHRSADSLCQRLSSELTGDQIPLVVTDGVFPTTGEIAPLRDYLEVVAEFGGLTWVDDAHGLGITGDKGQGTVSHFKLDSPSLLFGGTLAKAFGGFGGLVAGPGDFVDAVRSGPVVSNASPPPSPIAAATLEGLRLFEKNPAWLTKLRKNTRTLKDRLRNLGLNVSQNEVPIASFTAGSADRMRSIRESLLQKNIYIQHSNYFGAGSDGVLRLVVSSQHTEEQVNRLVDELERLV